MNIWISSTERAVEVLDGVSMPWHKTPETEENEKKAKEGNTEEDRIKEEIEKLKKELAEIKSKKASTEKAQEMLDNKAKAISQQISALGMQLIQIQKMNNEAGSV